MLYQIWFIPTEKGKKFGWTLKAVRKPFDDIDEAGLEAYMLNCDGRASDQSEYCSYRALLLEDFP